MDESRQDILRDLVAVLTALCFVLGAALGLLLGVFYTLGPELLGPLNRPIGNPLLAIGVASICIVLVVVGGLAGGLLWLVIMSRFLPKETMYKWLAYGPQIKPLLKFNLRLLNSLYAK